MSRRQARARLLAPSFLAVVAFAGCGDQDDRCAEDRAESSACLGDINPPRLEPCPPEAPEQGELCDELGVFLYPDECPYSVEGCGEVVATCNYDDGVWEVQGACASAGGGGGAAGNGGAGGEGGGA